MYEVVVVSPKAEILYCGLSVREWQLAVQALFSVTIGRMKPCHGR